MMSISSLSLLVFSCVVVAQAAEIPPEDLAVDLTTTDGIRIQFPYFRNSLKTINETLAGYIREDIHEILEYTYKNIESPPSYAGWLKVAGVYAMMCRRHVNRRKALGIRLGLNGEFNESMKDMFFRVLEKSKEEESKLKAMKAPKDRKALNKKIRRSLDVLEEVIQASPVASYLDLANGRVNGENFEDHSAKLMGELKYNGVGGILDYVGGLLKLLAMLTGSKAPASDAAPAA